MIININKIRKSYSKRIILNDFNLQVSNNEFIMITGKSGCGKTTLLKCLTGEIDIDEGNIFYDNLNIKNHKEYLLSEIIGYVKQGSDLLVECTNEQLIHINHSLTNKPWDQKWYETIIDHLNIQSILNKHPQNCSIGECQRVALAMALIKKPSVLLLDEPTGNLDENNTASFINLLIELRKIINCTIIMVTHETSLLEYADRVIDLTAYKEIETNSTPESAQLETKFSNTGMIKFIFCFYQFHFLKIILSMTCIAFVFLACYLSLNSGKLIKEYVYHVAYNQENSRIIRVSNNDIIEEKVYKDFNNIDGVIDVKGPTIKRFYGFERYENMENQIMIEDKKLKDSDLQDGLNFHGMGYDEIIAGTDVPIGTDLVLSHTLVDELGYGYEEIIGKTITYSFPYAYGYYDSILYDDSLGITYKDNLPVMHMMELKGKVVGVVRNEYYDIFHDSSYIGNLVVEQIRKDRMNNQYISPFDQNEVLVEIDDVSNLTKILKTLRDKGFTCKNDAEYLLNNIEIIDRQTNIFRIITFFVLIVMIYVLILIVRYINQLKINACHKLRIMGASNKQLHHYLLLDAGFMFFITSIYSICFTIILLPVFNKLFAFSNQIILLIQITMNENIPFFNLSIIHIVLCIIFILLVSIVIYINSYRQLRRKIT
ncbi:MAG: ATP-binding cassette domain-containing protein [Traorella sp.]